MFDTGLANRIRAKGVEVIEVAGWQTRGSSSFAPRGGVNHHTAGPASGVTPSLETCIHGRSDVPGPLCNVLQSREPSGMDKAYLIAAGRANHAGSGGWRGLTGNSSVHGLEIEHIGTTSVSPERVKVSILIQAAFLEAPGSSRNSYYTCQHFEWAPTRKIDFNVLGMTPEEYRSNVQYWVGRNSSNPIPAPTPPAEDAADMRLIQGPKAIALIGVGFWRTCADMDEVTCLQAGGIPGPRHVDQHQWDEIKNSVLNPTYVDD